MALDSSDIDRPIIPQTTFATMQGEHRQYIEEKIGVDGTQVLNDAEEAALEALASFRGLVRLDSQSELPAKILEDRVIRQIGLLLFLDLRHEDVKRFHLEEFVGNEAGARLAIEAYLYVRERIGIGGNVDMGVYDRLFEGIGQMLDLQVDMQRKVSGLQVPQNRERSRNPFQTAQFVVRAMARRHAAAMARKDDSGFSDAVDVEGRYRSFRNTYLIMTMILSQSMQLLRVQHPEREAELTAVDHDLQQGLALVSAAIMDADNEFIAKYLGKR